MVAANGVQGQRFGLSFLPSLIGGSKRTIYKYFGDKDGLFAAIVEQLCEEIVTPLTHMDLKRLSRQEALSTIAHTFLEVLLAPRTIALHRLIVAEAPRAPASAQDLLQCRAIDVLPLPHRILHLGGRCRTRHPG